MRPNMSEKAEITPCVQQTDKQTKYVRLPLLATIQKHAEGSVLVEFGDTKVLCNATVEEGVPRFFLRTRGKAG